MVDKEQKVIDDFSGEYECFSNFSDHTVTCNILGNTVICKTGEHAFQALKATNKRDRDYVLDAPSPRLAKWRGRRIQLGPDWEQNKGAAMLMVVYTKAMQHEKIVEVLLKTGDALIIEGNYHGDDEWGMVRENLASGPWRGKNKLGVTWMVVRDIIPLGIRNGFWVN